jgi:hypothetical protein
MGNRTRLPDILFKMVFPGDERWLMDMRRSGTVEAVAGGADALGFAAKLANSIDRSNTLHKTYAPAGGYRGGAQHRRGAPAGSPQRCAP